MLTAIAPSPPLQLTVNDLLARAIAVDASDLHLVVGSPPTIRVHGQLRAMAHDPLSAPEVERLIEAIWSDAGVPDVRARRDADFSLERDVDGHPRRFRVNVFRACGHLGCAIRIILDDIPSFEWAGFPSEVADRLAALRNGLVLFTGITGSGKSTTMAMLINLFNQRGGYRIITIEEPIEYVFAPGRDMIISQREVGRDLSSFADGLKYGLRQDPDVILVGEVRDRTTAQLALSAAETGHLVLTTMHTRDAKGAITRLTDMFEVAAQAEIRTQLALSLRAVVSQHLLQPARQGDRRVLALEVLINTLPIMSAIRSGRVETISDAILTGRSDGMLCLDEWLRFLIQSDRITLPVARRCANDPCRFA